MRRLLGWLNRVANSMETHHRFIIYTQLELAFVLGILMFTLAVSQFFVTTDNDVRLYPNEPMTRALVQGKYVILAIYPLSAVIVGSIFRWYFRRGNSKSNWWNHLLDVGKAGILVGGLASAKLAGIVAIVRELSIDTDAISSESIVFIAMIPIIIVVLVAYITGRGLVRKA